MNGMNEELEAYCMSRVLKWLECREEVVKLKLESTGWYEIEKLVSARRMPLVDKDKYNAYCIKPCTVKDIYQRICDVTFT